MTPGSFDSETSREMVGHERSLTIEAKARRDADVKSFDPPDGSSTGTSYWSKCQAEFERVVYVSQYMRRLEKLERAGKETEVDPTLLKIISECLVAQHAALAEFKSGKEKALNSVVGMIIGQCKRAGITFDAAQITSLIKQQVT